LVVALSVEAASKVTPSVEAASNVAPSVEASAAPVVALEELEDTFPLVVEVEVAPVAPAASPDESLGGVVRVAAMQPAEVDKRSAKPANKRLRIGPNVLKAQSTGNVGRLSNPRHFALLARLEICSLTK
jgi:hypothetical protein